VLYLASRCHLGKIIRFTVRKILMEEANFAYSLNTHLLSRPINLPDDWEARWCESLGRYESHNSMTDVTKSDFPTPSATLSISYPRKMSGGPYALSTPRVLDLLPEEDASSNTQSNLDSAQGIYPTRKRKRQSTKDPTKFKHECRTCGERFTRSTTLREHSRTHTDERPFPCSKCSKTFARKKDKIRHENLHLGEKTFYCRLEGQDAERGCGRCFAREDGLAAHLRTERGWKCLQDFMASKCFKARIEIPMRHENGFSCKWTRNGCHREFHDFSGLREHLQDRANRECANEWLATIFQQHRWINRLTQRFTDTDSGASEAERSDSRHPTSQDRQEPRASASDDSRLPNGALVLLSDVAEAVDLPSPGRCTIETARQNETMEIDGATTISNLRDEVQSTEASTSGFDPLASWDFLQPNVTGDLNVANWKLTKTASKRGPRRFIELLLEMRN
jgi:hypothetical protein